jgi:hypothetical protein
MLSAPCPGFLERHGDDSERFMVIKNIGVVIPFDRLGHQRDVAKAIVFP